METKRLMFIRPTLDFKLEYLKLRNDSFFLDYNPIPPVQADEVSVEIERLLKKRYCYFLIDKDTNSLVGQIDGTFDYFRYRVNSTSVSYYVGIDYARKGYMQEALQFFIKHLFFEENMEVISARVFSSNIPSRNLLEKLSFRLEGTLIDALRLEDGSIIDDCLYAITKEEYTKKQPTL